MSALSRIFYQWVYLHSVSSQKLMCKELRQNNWFSVLSSWRWHYTFVRNDCIRTNGIIMTKLIHNFVIMFTKYA
jgi:hypothetical protein